MSLSWTETRAALLPGRAVLSLGRGAVVSIEAGSGWEGALDALRQCLEDKRAKAILSLTLSHHFVRLFVLEPPPVWLRHGEMLAWLSDRLGDILEETGAWRLVWQDTPPGRPVAVCAMPAERLDALQTLLARHGRRARHIRPWLDAIWPRRQRRLARGTYWYALLEPGMASLLLIGNGRIRRLRQRHLGDDVASELGAMLHREAILSGMPPTGEVWLERAMPALDLEAIGPQWRVHELAVPADPGLAFLS